MRPHKTIALGMCLSLACQLGVLSPGLNARAGEADGPLDRALVTAAADAIAPKVRPKRLTLEQRRAETVQQLKAETLEESLNRLKRGPYSCALFTPEPYVLFRWPIPPVFELFALEMVLGSRRFMKAMDDLGHASAQEGAGALIACLDQALSDYIPAFDAYLTRCLERNAEHVLGTGRSMSPAFRLVYRSRAESGDAPRRPPSVSMLRWQILALLLAAGNLEYSDAKAVVLRALQVALTQRERILAVSEDELKDSHRAVLIAHHTLYNRIILATAVSGVAAGGAEFAGKGPLEVRKHVFRASPFDAHVTRLEAAHQQHSPVVCFDASVTGEPRDMGRGFDEDRGIDIWWVEGVDTDEEFDAFLDAYGLPAATE